MLLKDLEAVPPAAEPRRVAGLRPGKTEPFRPSGGTAASSPNYLQEEIINALALVVVPIALASLLVGGVGVMNIMLVSVKERATEIGIRRAFGARRSDILSQFLFEASVLTGVGGIIGIIVGFIFAFLVRIVVKFPAAVPCWSVVAGLGASVIVGVIAGMWPALRAANLDPVVAMRWD